MRSSRTLAAIALAGSASATTNYLGFNSGSTSGQGVAKNQSDFEREFKNAQNLVGAPGNFNAVRLYTNIQGGTVSDPISAFDAAVSTNTSLLLGVWASGTSSIDNELNALKAGLSAHGSALANLVIGISIGSEDLYRNGVTGQINDGNPGADPSVLVNFINNYKSAFANTALANVPVGHVDTWDSWTNGSNKAVIDAVDFIGIDEYPYYQNGTGNTIENAASLFQKAYDAVTAVSGGKSVWVTETGWPYDGPQWDQAVASVENAKKFWDQVGCDKLFNKVPTFWYNLAEDNSANTMKFAISDNESTTARFNLTCPAVAATSPNSTATATGRTTGSPAGATGSPSGSGTQSGGSSSSSVATTSGASDSKMGSSIFAAVAFMVAAFALI